MHGIPKLLSLILLWAIVLPQSGQSVNSDPAFPDFTKAADIQRLVYGSFRQALFGTDTSMTFASKQKYTIHFTKNTIFSTPLNQKNPDTVLSRFKTVQDILILWTQNGAFKPSYLPFKNFLLYCADGIDRRSFDIDLLRVLFAESYASNPNKFIELIQVLGYSVTNVTSFQPLVSDLGIQFEQELDQQLFEGQVARDFQYETYSLLTGNISTPISLAGDAVDISSKSARVQRFKISVTDTCKTRVTLQLIDSPTSNQIIEKVKQMLAILDLDTAMVETITISEEPFLDENFFANNDQEIILKRFNAILSLIKEIAPLINLSKTDEPLWEKAKSSYLAAAFIFDGYRNYYNENYEPDFNPIFE